MNTTGSAAGYQVFHPRTDNGEHNASQFKFKNFGFDDGIILSIVHNSIACFRIPTTHDFPAGSVQPSTRNHGVRKPCMGIKLDRIIRLCHISNCIRAFSCSRIQRPVIFRLSRFHRGTILCTVSTTLQENCHIYHPTVTTRICHEFQLSLPSAQSRCLRRGHPF